MIVRLSLALLLTVPLLAHHSMAAGYDLSKLMTFKGVVASVLYRNPHSYVEVDVKDENGAVTRWTFETAAAGALGAHGWLRDTVIKGDQVTITAYRAKRDENRGSARKLVMEDGRQFDCADRFATNRNAP
jgi:hypothetical protein